MKMEAMEKRTIAKSGVEPSASWFSIAIAAVARAAAARGGGRRAARGARRAARGAAARGACAARPVGAGGRRSRAFGKFGQEFFARCAAAALG
jgi:hypothetical protein